MKRILLAPLDWGLGHATRCIPIVRALMRLNHIVHIAGSGDSLTLLKNEFPELIFFTLPAYKPRYSPGKSLVWSMARQVPKFISVIREERRVVASIMQSHHIDLVISDNRYGCWSPKTPSVFITHQLNILMPKGFGWLSKAVRSLNRKLIGNFSFCWVPDYPDRDSSLSGMLSSDHASDRIRFIGPLSRFRRGNANTCQYDVLCILSGPEPQRSIFEKKLLDQLRVSRLRFLLVRGIFSEDTTEANVVPFLNSTALETVMNQADVVIARSGYSTIMDLAALGKRGILVPTPGQTEQEYLADRWSEKGILYAVSQNKFNLMKAWADCKQYAGFDVMVDHPTENFVRALNEVLQITRHQIGDAYEKFL